MMRRRQQPEPEDAKNLLPPLAAVPPAEDAGGPALARLNVLAYNFFQLPWYAMPCTHKRARIDEFCDGPAARYDVCCLTEVWRDPVRNNRRYLAERAARIGGLQHAAIGVQPPCCSCMVTDGGLMTLSRLPLVEVCSTIFAASGGLPDSLVGNGCLYSRIVVNGCRLHVYSAHLQSDTSLWKMGAVPGSQQRPRQLQLEEMARFMSECQRGEGEAADAVLICGDLNIGRVRFASCVFIREAAAQCFFNGCGGCVCARP